jgi:hypothetical protein
VTLLPGAHGDAIVLRRRAAPVAAARLEDHSLPGGVLDWMRGPYCAPRDAVDAASGLVIVAATSADLVRSLSRALLARFDASSACLVAVPSELAAAAASRPDVLVAEHGSDAGLAADAALSGARVVLGVVGPSPVDSVLDLLDTSGVRHRLARAVAAVVLLDQRDGAIVADGLLAGPALRGQLLTLAPEVGRR